MYVSPSIPPSESGRCPWTSREIVDESVGVRSASPGYGVRPAAPGLHKALSSCALWLLTAMLLTQVAGAQKTGAFAGYTSHLWQAPDGLPEQTVQAFAQTPDGYLWIGTTGGLLRFDGAHFTVFDRQNTPDLNARATTLCGQLRKTRTEKSGQAPTAGFCA
jgi:hypothetical protein